MPGHYGGNKKKPAKKKKPTSMPTAWAGTSTDQRQAASFKLQRGEGLIGAKAFSAPHPFRLSL